MTTTREAALEAALKYYADPKNHEKQYGNDMGYQYSFTNIEGDAGKVAIAALSTPATEPHGYVEVSRRAQNLMEVALWTELHEAMIKDGHEPPRSLGANATSVIKQTVADYLEALAARPDPQPAAPSGKGYIAGLADAARALGEYCDSQHFKETLKEQLVDVIRNLAGKPAADTRVVTVAQLETWAGEWRETLRFLRDGVMDAEWVKQDIVLIYEIRAIIGTATPAPSDKIADAARVLLEWWNQDTPDNIALDARKVIGVMNALRENEGDGFEQFDAALRALAGQGETP